MKPYFVKYFPVEGKLKKGDEISFIIKGRSLRKPILYFKYPNGDKTQPFSCVVVRLRKDEYMEGPFPIRYFGGDHWGDDVVEMELERSRIGLAKLFLCGRDIQVGDTFRHNLREEEFVAVEVKDDKIVTKKYPLDTWPIPNEHLFKVIGEISPEAKWIKEGDEFDEGEIRQTIKSKRSHIEEYFDTECHDTAERPIFENYLLIEIKGPCGHFH